MTQSPSWVGKTWQMTVKNGENCKYPRRIINKKWHSEKKKTIASFGLGQNVRAGGSQIKKFLQYLWSLTYPSILTSQPDFGEAAAAF